ncbi:rhodanese-like domain-containing protein [Microbulbifer sp. A4B17]|uniref:rhodanese-like domain-containing protein n=1 Tax=Microbulbifer sp. A4B17 TaxID=359370 RepID=UPI000D52D041|nr:rhodanese-like domain-containing protein [Microbulbifer sp. A4B17]AWF83117.1 rhodanese-like domain-containing protein [Microbulbifer sp. A4B17]
MDFLDFLAEQWLLVGLLVALLYAFVLTERYKSGEPASLHEVTKLINSDGAKVLDIRDRSEFTSGHIVDSLHIPHGDVAERIAELESFKDKTIIVADKMGQHAGPVGRMLKQKGFQVRRLQGGMSEWANQNLPVVKGKG